MWFRLGSLGAENCMFLWVASVGTYMTGEREKLTPNMVVTEALDNRTGSSGAGTSFQNYLQLKQGNLTLTSLG